MDPKSCQYDQHNRGRKLKQDAQECSYSHDEAKQHKRPRLDSLGRMAASVAKSGRGALEGWTLCPLCTTVSTKRFALGRGIAAHLHAVHAPWNPGKAERRKRRLLAERQQFENQRSDGATTTRTQRSNPQVKWDAVATAAAAANSSSWKPTEADLQQWEEQVLRIVKELEEAAAATDSSSTTDGKVFNRNKHDGEPAQSMVDRNGEIVLVYRQSLPPFIAAAADGNLASLKEMLSKASTPNAQMDLLNSRDRHLSTAEHWAAGEGHLDCLKFLIEKRRELDHFKNTNNNNIPVVHDDDRSLLNESHRKIRRRRDGKTGLHYAARNGRLDCVKYLIDECGCSVDDKSGDGTTPFHLACFGVHLETARLLLDRGADPHHVNDWGCGVAHWVALAKNYTIQTITELLNFLNNVCHVDFTRRQKQGHSVLHKAAQNQNYAVLQWFMTKEDDEEKCGHACTGERFSGEQREWMGAMDLGGHKPSSILLNVGGNPQFARRMMDQYNW